jgi:hypothetical protein
MEYVEILRARRVLTWYCGTLLAVLAIAVLSVYSGHSQMHGSVGPIHLSDLLKGCAFGAIIVATCMAPGINAESSTLAIAWTRPMSRTAIAWRYIAVDAVTIVLGYAFAVFIALAFLAAFGLIGNVGVDGDVPMTILNGIGSSLMWYGLVNVVVARMDGRGGMISGLSWAVFLVIGGLWAAPFPPLIHGLLTFLNYFNPLTYFQSVSSSHSTSHEVLVLSPDLLTLIAWCFVAVTLVATVRLWSTREV